MEALRERFGKYHVLEKIAQGGMAEVYKVKTIGIAGFEKVQALKRILPNQAREGRFIRSFIDEARIAVELTHRNIVQVFDFGKADGELFMAMELIEGRDLRTAMMQSVSRDCACPIPVAAHVIAEVAAGLDYAHRKTDGYGGTLGIVHCDVSPSNVMLSADGYVKILDFGIARATFSSALERRRLRGKPRYMAPEQTLGEPPTAAADVFALGIIAWELFTGLPLYRGSDIKSILEAVRRTDPPRIDRMNPQVPKEIVDAIATALCREAAARGTAADLSTACARTAMTSGARQLAAWLKDLDERSADSASVSWQSLPASASMPRASGAHALPPPPTAPHARPSTSAMAGPPLRQSTRSMTGSILANVPPAPSDFGEGTPHSLDHSIDQPLPSPPSPRRGDAGGARTGTAVLSDGHDALPPSREETAVLSEVHDALPSTVQTSVHPTRVAPSRAATSSTPTTPSRTAGPTTPATGTAAIATTKYERLDTEAPTTPEPGRQNVFSQGPSTDVAGSAFADRGTTGAGDPFGDRGSTAVSGPAFDSPFGDRGTTGVGGPAFHERATTTGGSYQAFGDRDPTATVTVARQFNSPGDVITPLSPAPRFEDATRPAPRFEDVTRPAPRFEDTTRRGAKWDAVESTAAGVGKLQDALDAYARPIADDRPAPVSSGPSEPSRKLNLDAAMPAIPPPLKYERLEMTSTSAASMRFDDDDATQFGFAAPDAASFNDLQVEMDDDLPVDQPVIADEPIDDDLGVLSTGANAERRRTVVVAALLEGAPTDVLRPIARSLGELAYQRGGVVLRLTDEALLIAFGLEVAGEDDVAVAMGWALDAAAMTRDAGGIEQGAAGPRLRIGARTGVATSSLTTGTGEAFDGAETATRIPSEAIEEARALAREATPDRPMFVGAAGRVTSGLYELREVPAPKRIGRRSRVIEVVAPRGFGERDRARLERRGNFVGRTAQLAELEVWFQRGIAADRRLTALVSGAAGTGKSRLVAEFLARRAAAVDAGQSPPMRVVTTAANAANQLAPFGLVIDLYQAALGLPPSRGRGARQHVVQRLLHLMKEAGVAEDRARAVAIDLDRAMELRDGVGVSPEVADLRPRISAGLAAFRASMTDRNRPLLTIIEDVHLADTASLEVLRHTLAVTAMGPELLILTGRPEGPPPPPVDVVISIGDLLGPELRALITDRLGAAATPLNIATVMGRGGGNPLFIEELAQAVREAGDSGDAVPATARDVVAARVDKLSPKAKTAVRFAAVMGGSLRARLIEELMGEESLEAELDELVDAGFLIRPTAAAHSTEGELAFARGLVREVIYDSLSARAQRENHALVGRLLASRFFAGREEPPAVIADHMERGGEPAAAAAFWLRAGKLALTASDAGSAVAHFTRTLTLERELSPSPKTPTSRARRREALAGREEANRMLGDVVSNPTDLDELQRLCEGDTRRLADVSIRRAHRLLRLGDYAGANVATVVAEDYAMAVEDARLRGEALRVRGEVLERLGRFDEALVIVDDARELFAREGAVSDEMAAMVGRGRIHLMRAHYESARLAYKPVIARIEKTGDPWLERIVQNHVAIIEMCLGNFTVAMSSAQRSLELCRRYGDRSREGDALSVSGIILLEVGLHDRAAASFAEALDLLSRTASRWSRADCLIYAGVCDVQRGRADSGMAMLDEALAEARRLGARYLEANALVSRAGARLRLGQLGPAIADASEGTQVARLATLVGYEIQGLARHAVALIRDTLVNRVAEAGNLVQRALALLDAQHYLEGSEEEVYANCVEVLRAARAGDRAAAVKAAGRAEVERKLAGLSDPAWRAAYAALPECKALLG